MIDDSVGIFLYEYIKSLKPENILEIGFGSGYSSFFISEANPGSKIISLEKDKERYEKGVKLIRNFNKNIELLNIDFFDFIKNNKIKFDFVFIDGGKGQYIRYIKELEKDSMKEGTVIIADNIFLRGKMFSQSNKKREERMVKKIKEFCEYIKNGNFITEFSELGDGISISKYQGK